MEEKVIKYANRILEQNISIVNTVLCSSKILLEQKHLMQNIDIYYNIIWNKVSEITGVKSNRDFINPSPQNYNIIVTEKDFINVKTFFKKLKFSLNLTLTNDFGVYKYSGGYSPQSQTMNTDKGIKILAREDGKLFKVDINSNIVTSVATIREAIASVVYHEFTHAYEDWGRINKNKGMNSIILYAIYSNYSDLESMKSLDPPYSEELSNALYLLSQVETKAHIAQAIGEAKKMLEYKQNLSYIISNTQAYNNYVNLLDAAYSLRKITDINIQNNLLNIFNKFAGITNKKDDNGNYTLYHFKTYNQLSKWILNKSIFSFNKFVETISKYFEDNSIKNKLMIR